MKPRPERLRAILELLATSTGGAADRDSVYRVIVTTCGVAPRTAREDLWILDAAGSIENRFGRVSITKAGRKRLARMKRGRLGGA